MNDPVTFSDLGAVVSMLLVGATALGGVWWKIHRRISDVEARAEKIRSSGAHELAEFKLLVAEKYATQEVIKDFEVRLLDAINRLGDRFDKYYLDNGPRRRGGGTN